MENQREKEKDFEEEEGKEGQSKRNNLYHV